MNGTSKQELLDQMCNAISALQAALEAMQGACPNGRDYYPQGNHATQEALRQHANRLHNVKAALDEINEIAETIA
jgi:hypothetical protein